MINLELLDYALKGGLFLLVDHARGVYIVSKSMVPKVDCKPYWTSKDLLGDEFTLYSDAMNCFNKQLKGGVLIADETKDS